MPNLPRPSRSRNHPCRPRQPGAPQPVYGGRRLAAARGNCLLVSLFEQRRSWIHGPPAAPIASPVRMISRLPRDYPVAGASRAHLAVPAGGQVECAACAESRVRHSLGGLGYRRDGDERPWRTSRGLPIPIACTARP